jgi:hypothetical protein
MTRRSPERPQHWFRLFVAPIAVIVTVFVILNLIVAIE